MRIRIPSVVMVLVVCALGMGCVSTVHHGPVYAPPPAPAAVPMGAQGEPFYDELAPYGEWVDVPGPGWVWVPYDTPPGWRPYSLGHWVYTDYGWTWDSDEMFGHVVYHYGRWHVDPAYGWVWAPGTDWGPAWVAWHEGNGYVGWAPLPWQVSWQVGVGLDWGGVSVNVLIGPPCWQFVPTRHMVAPTLHPYVLPVSRNGDLIRTTPHVTNYITVNNHVVNHGAKVENVGRAVGHAIPQYRVRSADPHDRGRGAWVEGDEYVVERPAAGRGAKSQGRALPEGGGKSNRPGDRRREPMPPEPDSQATPPETTTSESGPSPGPVDHHPSRLNPRPRRSRTETPAPSPAAVTPASAPAAEPGPPVQPATSVRTHPDNRSGGDRADRNGNPERPGTDPGPNGPSRPATVRPEPGHPDPAKATSPASGHAKKPAAKSKDKKSGDAASKPVKPKPDGPGPQGSDSEKKTPENKDSADQS